MNDQDLEQLLRSTLTDRAGTVTRGAAWGTDGHREFARQPAGARRRTRWIAPLAAAAVVVAVSGLVALTQSEGGDRPTGAAPAGRSCDASLPDAWQQAMSSGHLDLNTQSPQLSPSYVSGTSDRGIVTFALGDDGAENVVLVGRSGRPRVLYRLADPRHDAFGPATLEARFALVPVQAGQAFEFADGRFDPPGTQPQYAVGAITDLLLIDLDSGQARQVARMSAADQKNRTNVIDGAALQDGRVYWDVRPDQRSRDGRVLELDIAGGRTRTIATGPVSGPTKTPAAVTWRAHRVLAKRHLPPAVEKVVEQGDRYAYLGKQANRYGYLVTDGRNFAWSTPDGRIAFTHGTAVQYIRQSVAHTPELHLIVGPYVFFNAYDDSSVVHVMDTRSRAIASTGLEQAGPTYTSNGRS